MYELIFAKRALEELSKLETEIKDRIWNKLQLTKENPFRFFEKLVEIPGFKLRVGDYRVLADISPATNKIYVKKVGHRRNIYEN